MPYRALSLVAALFAALALPSAAAAAPPANDNFSNPVVLTGTSGSYSGNNSQANVALQAGEPDHAAFTDGVAGRSVWFRWQAPAGVGQTTISLCDSADTADSVVAVYTGSAVNALTLVPGAHNDDGCGIVGGPSEVNFTPTAGTTYRIAVADWDSDDGAINGPYELALLPTPGAPANDDFANAEVLTGTTDTFSGNNVRATMETGEPNHAAPTKGTARKSVWFRWQAPSSGTATVSLCDSGTSADSVVAVYAGTAVNSLGSGVAFDDDGCGNEEGPSVVTWPAAAGTTYRIAVADWDPDSGIGHGFELDFSFTPDVADPPPDTQITGAQDFSRTTTFDAGGFTTNVSQPLTISFGSQDADIGHFECLIDGVVVSSTCVSPYSTTDPPGGSHTFSARAVDIAGNVDPTPATRAFSVDRTPPSVSITAGPADGSTTNDTTPSFTVATESGATLVCRLDSGDYEQCPGTTFETPELDLSTHTVEVWSIDTKGNVGGPASRTFTVVEGPSTACADAQAALTAAEEARDAAAQNLTSAQLKLQQAKQSGKRKKIKRAKAKVKAAQAGLSEATAAVDDATANVLAACI